MNCPKYHGFCDTFGAVNCGGDCARCKSSATANALTIGEWEEAYRSFVDETHAVAETTLKVSMSHLHSFMARTGLASTDSMAKIDRSIVQSFYIAANDLRPVTRKGIIDNLTKMTSEKFREWAKDKNLTISSMPSSKGLAGGYERYRQISNESMKRLRDIKWEYRQSEDPRKWLILTLALDFGMSKADILNAKWRDIFTNENGVTLVSYCRLKTGKRAMWKVTDEQMRDFRRAEELSRKMSTRGVRRGTEESILRNTDGKRANTSAVWNEVSNDLRRSIPEWENNTKSIHNCRKEFATKICRTHGWEIGEIATGDTTKILQKSYVGKLLVDWKNI